MRLEGEYRRRPAGRASGVPHRLDQRPVAAMHAIEIANRRHRTREGHRDRIVRATDREGPRSRLVAWGHRVGIGCSDGLA